MLVGLSLPHLNYHAVIEGLVSSFKDFVNAIIFQMLHKINNWYPCAILSNIKVELNRVTGFN